jgi:hypothetical protein
VCVSSQVTAAGLHKPKDGKIASLNSFFHSVRSCLRGVAFAALLTVCVCVCVSISAPIGLLTHTPRLEPHARPPQLSVTVPNAYNEHTKEEIKDIFDAAGVPKPKLTILNESLAGMLGYIRACRLSSFPSGAFDLVVVTDGGLLTRIAHPTPTPQTSTWRSCAA